MDNAKKLKRGEFLFKEGEAQKAIYMIQTGKIALIVPRGDAKGLEVATIGASQVLGEGAMFSTARHDFSAEALQEVKYLEVPIEVMKAQYEKCPPGVKLMVKSMVDDMKIARKYMKASKLENEKSPCPQGLIHRLFTELHLIVRHIGKQVPDVANAYTVSWSSLKLYSTRFFGQSPQRLRDLMDLLAKLKLAELSFAKTEEGEDELQNIHLHNLQGLEDFAEFFQYHLFKGARAEAIYVDPLALKVARALTALTEGMAVDHKGGTHIEWSAVLSECKTRFKMEIKNTHLDVLERKGLFVQRKSYDDGRLELILDRNEFEKTSRYWGILYEIDQWNEKGFVDMKEPKEEASSDGSTCEQCSGAISAEHRFCPHCGFKLTAAA